MTTTTKRNSVARRAKAQSAAPTPNQLSWLKRGHDQPGGKLPLFDETGQRINQRTIKSCLTQGWAEPWFQNPIKPDWLVCKLTKKGRKVSGAE